MSKAVVAEAEEEAGVLVEVIGLVGSYTNPHHVMAFDDGEVRQECCFTTRPVRGQLRSRLAARNAAFPRTRTLTVNATTPTITVRHLSPYPARRQCRRGDRDMSDTQRASEPGVRSDLDDRPVSRPHPQMTIPRPHVGTAACSARSTS
jgi:hypothetical protein